MENWCIFLGLLQLALTIVSELPGPDVQLNWGIDSSLKSDSSRNNVS